MSVLTSRPVLRWALPAGLVAVVLGGGALVTTMQASADVRLPPRSAAQLLVDVQTARLEGVSGTVVERADLGLIALPPGIGGGAAGSSGIDLASLISGSNTMRVWYSGKDKARVALIRSNGESDIVHNGTDTWLWNSRDNTATHYQESDKDARPHPEAAPSGLPADLPKTPQEAADRVLAALDPTTVVTTDSNALVAKHKAYQLVLRPGTPRRWSPRYASRSTVTPTCRSSCRCSPRATRTRPRSRSASPRSASSARTTACSRSTRRPARR